MKNNLKKIGYGFVLLVVLGFLSYGGSHIFAAQEQNDVPVVTSSGPGNYTHKALIHRGGGHQYIKGVLNLVESLSGISFGATSNTEAPAVFEKPTDPVNGNTSFFSVLGTSWIGGRMFVGVPRGPGGFRKTTGFLDDRSPSTNIWMKSFTNPSTFNQFSATLQKVNVQGDALATNLKHDLNNHDNVCIDANGSLVICTDYSCLNVPSNAHRCDAVEPTADTNAVLEDPCDTTQACHYTCDVNYHLENGTCVPNTCTGSIQTNNAHLCDDDDQGLTTSVAKTLVDSCSTPTGSDPKCEYTCDSGYHLENGECVINLSYHWATDDWGNCVSDGQATCSGSIPSSRNTCLGNGRLTVEHISCNGDDCVCVADETTTCSEFGQEGLCPNGNGIAFHLNEDFLQTGIFSTQKVYAAADNNETTNCPTYFTGHCHWEKHCSDKDGTNKTECENYDSACQWGETYHHTRNVWCEDNNGQTVADTYCDASTRPSDNENCDPGITVTYSNPIDSCYQGAYDRHEGFEKIMTVTNGQPHQVIPYTWDAENGHAGSISFTHSSGVVVDPGTPAVSGQLSGNVTLDASGGGTFDLKVCGGPDAPNGGSNSGFHSAEFKLQGVGSMYIYGNGRSA